MKTTILFFVAFAILACNLDKNPKIGSYSGTITHGNFSDNITLELAGNSSVFFTSLEQNANRITFQNVAILGNNLDDATALQSKVFEYIAGQRSKTDLEFALDKEKSKAWFSNIWVPNLDETQTDEKLNFTPIPYFETTKQPVLILQGTLDEIIPTNSHKVISDALLQAGNNNFKVVLLDEASHSMNFVGKSDFPYWSKLHPEYFNTIEEWINSVSNLR